MSDVLLIIAVGTTLFLSLGIFIAFMTLTYQKKRLQHHEEVKGLIDAYQKEILKAQIEMQEQTFLSISQEIHDNVGQILSLVRLNVSTLGKAENIAAEQKILSSKELLDQVIGDLRDLSKRLNSKYVARQELSCLLKFQIDLIAKTGVASTHFDVQGEEKVLNPEKKLMLFRISQEALNNAVRHAEASTITIKLEYKSEKTILSISDDGKGFTAPGKAEKNGLSQGTGTYNMYYRASLIGAKLRIQSTRGKGTQVLLELPAI